MRAYKKAAYIVFSPIHEHTFTHSFIMKGVMEESFPPSHLSVKPYRSRARGKGFLVNERLKLERYLADG